MIDRDALIQLIGSTELSIAASWPEDEQVAARMVRQLRRIVGIGDSLVVYDDVQRTYRLVTSPKAAARLARKASR